MKVIVAMLCGAACFSTPVLSQQQTTTSTETLVKTAKAAKESQKKHPPTKVITNKDVKQSKGKLIVLDKPLAPVPKTDTTSPIEKQDAKIRARKEAEARVAAAQKKADALQKQLDDTEQHYYEENDPNYRDDVIRKHFADTQRQLDAARLELASARDALAKIESQK